MTNKRDRMSATEEMMGTRTKEVFIPIDNAEAVSGVISIPLRDRKGMDKAMILAHGAGNDMNQPLLVYLASKLTQASCLTLRFNFPYKEKGKKAPDPQKKLEATWLAVYSFLRDHPEYGTEHIIAAGKSMGGRIASQLASDGRLPVEKLIFLGYPLHPPGQTEKLRDSHLYSIKAPMLFFAGTRDSLCNLEQLAIVLNKLQTPWELAIIEGGDHSFRTPKSMGPSEQDVYRHILDKTMEWLELS
ncbi:MAG: dienelactone hydrolase family protein [Candidatus Aminicenantes bacterium]